MMILVSAVSCQHKDLCYDHPHNGKLRVVFDWTKASGTVDENMELFLFPDGGGPALHYQFYNMSGGVIEVPAGVYRAVCANAGAGANRFEGTSASYGEFKVTTRAVNKAGDIIVEPDMLYSDHLDDGIDIDGVSEQTLVMYPVQKAPRYTVILRNVRNLNGAKSCAASLSNLSCGYLAALDEAYDDSHIQNFDMSRSGETELEGPFIFFGHRHSGQRAHILMLDFALQNGSDMTCTVDVTERMAELAREGCMTGDIIIDLNIDIPKPITNGSGFQPTVDGWGNEEININN